MLLEEHSGETSLSSVKSPRLRLVVETLPCGAVKFRSIALSFFIAAVCLLYPAS